MLCLFVSSCFSTCSCLQHKRPPRTTTTTPHLLRTPPLVNNNPPHLTTPPHPSNEGICNTKPSVLKAFLMVSQHVPLLGLVLEESLKGFLNLPRSGVCSKSSSECAGHLEKSRTSLEHLRILTASSKVEPRSTVRPQEGVRPKSVVAGKGQRIRKARTLPFCPSPYGGGAKWQSFAECLWISMDLI